MAGAAYLSAKAAYAVGAGLVQIYTAEENRTVLQELLLKQLYRAITKRPESLMIKNWKN